MTSAFRAGVRPVLAKAVSRHHQSMETLSFAGSFLVHSVHTGAVAVLNPTAMSIWRALVKFEPGKAAAMLAQEWQGDTETIRAEIDQCLRDWWRAGLFEQEPAAPISPQVPSNWPWKRVVMPGDRPLMVRSSSETVGRALDAVLEPLLARDTTNADATVDFLSSERRYAVRVDDECQWASSDYAQTHQMFLRAVLEQAYSGRRPGAVLHASAAVRDGQAVILAGHSGAGKSTLLSSLTMRRGYSYLADDLVGLSPDGDLISGLPASISIKSGSRVAVQRLVDGSRNSAMGKPDAFGVSSLTTPNLKGWFRPTRLIFPRRQADADGVRIEPLDPLRCLAGLLETGTRPGGIPRSMRGLCRLCEDIPSFDCTYREADEAIAALDRLAEC